MAPTPTDRGEFLDRLDVNYHLENGDRIELRYESSTSGTEQTVRGEVDDAHMTEETTVMDDRATVYRVIGNGYADREPGEIVKNDRRIGWFTRAYRLEDD